MDYATNIALLILLLACAVMLALYVRKEKGSAEYFVDPVTPPLSASFASFGIVDLAEAKSIVTGEWNEQWQRVPKNSAIILYYSVWSHRSRVGLIKSPYTWTNMSPVFESKLPENCKVDDSKVVFMSRPFNTDPTVLGMYVNGIELNTNKGNGPLAMNTGLNIASLGGTASDPQRFSLAFFVKFNNLTKYNGQPIPSRIELLNMRANTSNNNGIKIGLAVSGTAQPELYNVAIKVAFGDGPEQTSSVINVKTYPDMYYGVGLVRSGSIVKVTLHEVNTREDTERVLTSLSITHNNTVDFSNMPLQIGGGDNPNVINVLAFGVAQLAYTEVELAELVKYWKSVAVKTGPVAYALCQQALALRACPFGDSNVCNTCPEVTDWRNVNQLVTASAGCKSAYAAFCLSNPTLPGCECYGANSLSNQNCMTWRNMISGTSTCTQTDINSYLEKNNVCATTQQAAVVSKAAPITLRIRDYITAEDYVLEAADKSPEKGFWQWLFGI